MRRILAVLAVPAAAALGFAAAALVVLAQGLPQVSRLEAFRPPAATRVYAADGSLLAEFSVETRIPVTLDDLPPHAVRAFLAIEDHRFFEHFGLNVGRILKALAVDVLEGRVVEGGSTITQQLAKVLFLTPERTLRRKLREALLALEIERRYTKREILEFYLNQIYLGNGAYGVGAAARAYFGKTPSELTLADAALLAALPKAPARYDPFRNPEKARARRNLVLRRMADLGWADPEEAARAAEAPLPSRPPQRPVRAPYFVERVRRELVETLGLDPVYQGGLRVYTTLDPSLQEAAEAALAEGLRAVDARHPGRKTPAQGAVVVLDLRTGAVRAHVGGRSWDESPFDRAVQARRQPGSAFKFFVYLAALERGFTQADTLLDAPGEFPGSHPRKPWRPMNYDGRFEGEMTLRLALARSRNLPAVRLLDRIGRQPVEDLARRLGLKGPFGQGLAEALGVGAASPLELARAYAAAATGGVLPEPRWIQAVHGPDGRNLWPAPAPARRVLDPVVAYCMTDMLRAVVQDGTGRAARGLPFPVAGKTGTTDDQRDAWFIGFSSRLAAAVWVGCDDNTPLGRGETGARAALPVWTAVMGASAGAETPPPWPVPPGVSFVEIDVRTGLRAGPDCRDKALAAFARGTEPSRPCDHDRLRWPRLLDRVNLASRSP
ncbi:penicillin-binding protein 1A [Deferrisoma sp.]